MLINIIQFYFFLNHWIRSGKNASLFALDPTWWLRNVLKLCSLSLFSSLKSKFMEKAVVVLHQELETKCSDVVGAGPLQSLRSGPSNVFLVDFAFACRFLP